MSNEGTPHLQAAAGQGGRGRHEGWRRRRTSLWRAVAVVVLALSLVAGLPIVEGASLHRLPVGAVGLGSEPAAAAEAETDGCTKVPDRIWLVFNFYEACAAHDRCYRSYSEFRHSRGRCDWDFLEDMQADCVGRWWGFGIACEFMACVYYKGVRVYGEHSYESRSVGTPISHIISNTAELLEPNSTATTVAGLLSLYWRNPFGLAAAVGADLGLFCAQQPSDYWGTPFSYTPDPNRAWA